MRLIPDLTHRSTVDLVVLAVAFIISFVIVVTLLGVILIELVHPETDTESMVRMESEILGVLVGALVGFISGRNVGRSEAKEVTQ